MRRSLCTLLPASTFLLPAFRPAASGAPGTKDWRLFFKNAQDGVVSAWHDLPIRPELGGAGADPRIYTFTCEIPRGSRAKMELLKEEAHNPIAQDLHKKKEGKPLRFFTYNDIPFNYGFIPRTWEDPDEIDASTKCRGDSDPIDVVDVSAAVMPTGTVAPARVLGILGLIDEGETDWKIITETVLPGKEGEGYGSLDKVPQSMKDTIVDWFLNYKTTDGKPQNEFSFGGQIRGADDAVTVIEDCAKAYERLLQMKNPPYWVR